MPAKAGMTCKECFLNFEMAHQLTAPLRLLPTLRICSDRKQWC